MRDTPHRQPSGALGVVLAASLLFAPFEASAQVEYRCPAGWQRADNAGSLRATAHPQHRDAIAHCSAPTSSMSIDVDQLDEALPSEREWLARRLPDVEAHGGFTDAAIEGVAARVRLLEWVRRTPAQGHHMASASCGRAALIRVGDTLVTVVSTDQTHGDFSWTAPADAAAVGAHRAVFNAFVRSMIGLDAAPAAWSARAECPAGAGPISDGLQLVRGWRRVVRCRSSDGLVDVEVRESRVRVADLAAARAEAELAQAIQPWASAPRAGALSRATRAESGAWTAALSWPVLRDMGRDNRPRRARFAMAVVPTSHGVVEVGWLARDARAPMADASLRRYLEAIAREP